MNAALSLIQALALNSGVSCPDAFVSTVKKTGMPVHSEVLLERFADASCLSSNPDIFWAIAYRESSFRFFIVRDNDTGIIYENSDAIKILETITNIEKTTGKIGSYNFDIGPMQINYKWHGANFESAMDLLDPIKQVAYVTGQFGEYLQNQCGAGWIGCYHHPSNKDLASNYQNLVLAAYSELRRIVNIINPEKARFKLVGKNMNAPVLPQDSRGKENIEKEMALLGYRTELFGVNTVWPETVTSAIDKKIDRLSRSVFISTESYLDSFYDFKEVIEAGRLLPGAAAVNYDLSLNN